MANREEKSLGTKNMLDHLKNCTPSSCGDSSVTSGNGSMLRVAVIAAMAAKL